MTIEEFSRGHETRLVLAGMIHSREVLARAAQVWENPGPFPSPQANTIASWCVKYLRRYDKPPLLAGVTSLFAGWCNSSRPESTVRLIDSLLSEITDEHPDGLTESPQYVLDVASKLFRSASLERLRDQISAHLDLGEVDKAQEAYDSFKPVQMGQGSCVDLFQDDEAMKLAVEDTAKDVLITYPGALGKFYGDSLSRSCFVAYMGPEKRGKTSFMMDLAYRGILQRRRVAFFEVGDLSAKQIHRRFMIRACKNPLKHKTLKVPTSLKIEHKRNEDGVVIPSIDVELRDEEYTHPGWDRVKKKVDRVLVSQVKSRKPYLKVYTHPAGTVTVGLIESLMKEQASLGWVVDAVVVDYADLLTEPGFENIRDRTNEIWTKLRALSQKLDCLVITATQSDAASYLANTLGMKHFSEDKRKFAHVTGMVGINQKEDEKKMGVFRHNWVVLREDEFYSERCVYVAGCMGLCRPTMFSSF